MNFVFNVGNLTATTYLPGGPASPTIEVKCKDLLALTALYADVRRQYGSAPQTKLHWIIPVLTYNPENQMSNQLDVLEGIVDEDPFLRSYPTFHKYYEDWLSMGGQEAQDVPQHVVFDFYAEKQTPEQALHTWFTYDSF